MEMLPFVAVPSLPTVAKFCQQCFETEYRVISKRPWISVHAARQAHQPHEDFRGSRTAELNIPQDASPFVSGVLLGGEAVVGAGLATEALGEGFVVARTRVGDCTGAGGALAAGVNPLDMGLNPDGLDSGRGLDLKTDSKRARLKCERSAKPR